MVREEGGGGRARRAVDRAVDAPLGARLGVPRVQHPDRVGRNGHVLIQIFNVTESLVIAGVSEINKTMAHGAGAHGTVNRGTKNAKQVNFDMTTKL